eukprot:10246251-Alexandrium_andersonii.AAC.1
MRWFVVATWWPRSPKPWCCGVYAAPFRCLALRKARNSSATLLRISGPRSVRATSGTTRALKTQADKARPKCPA